MTIGSIWKTQLFPQSLAVGRVVVLPWEGHAPFSAKRIIRVALATKDGNRNSASFWRSERDLFPVDTPDAECIVYPPRTKGEST